ncbi:MAG: zf-HC2 domain-containing protein [Pseudomonadota bacterium]|nr:zf-HC2 domain-containing protein [Pseudomonadota bacterium]
MTHNRRFENSAEHQEVSALIPWYVNDTLDDHQRDRVDAHVVACASCREDLGVNKRIFEGIDALPALDYMPVASLKRLQARLDAVQAQGAAAQTASLEPVRSESPWRGWIAASIAAMAVAIGLLATDRWVQFEARGNQANYRTVTSAAPRPQGEVIRAVFSPTITLVQLQSILDEAQLKIVSGPTEAGVYSLASNSSLTVRSSLALLREHSTVRFAEATSPEPESGNAR